MSSEIWRCHKQRNNGVFPEIYYFMGMVNALATMLNRSKLTNFSINKRRLIAILNILKPKIELIH